MRKRAVAEQLRRGARGARMERRRTQNPSARREGETMEVKRYLLTISIPNTPKKEAEKVENACADRVVPPRPTAGQPLNSYSHAHAGAAGDVPEGLLATALNCQNRPGLYSKVNDDLVSSENGVTTVEKLRKYKYNPFLVYFTSL